MKSLRLIFNPDGIAFDLARPLNDFDCTVQNGLVDMAVRRGTDKLFPDKGTDLLKTALSGALVDLNAANHASTFAALAVLAFSRASEYPDATEVLAKVTVQPATFTANKLQVVAQFTSNLGTVRGVTLPLT